MDMQRENGARQEKTETLKLISIPHCSENVANKRQSDVLPHQIDFTSSGVNALQLLVNAID